MSKIYKIVNDINNKVYIGKTEHSIEKRFQEHCRDAYSREYEKRPLYSAMRKYGVNHFTVELIEECTEQESATREVYWIGYYKSYTNGYNATLGGDGKAYIDVQNLLSMWQEGKTLKEISTETHHDLSWISKKLKENGVPQEEIFKRSKDKLSTKVLMISNSGEIIGSFNSTREAARFLIQEKNKNPSSEGGYSAHISEVCRGIRKSCLGYKWQYADNG